MYKVLIIFGGLFFSACSSKFVAPLTKKQIQERIVGHTIYNNHEKFYIFDNGTFIYEDIDNSKKERGSWYLRSSMVDYKENRKEDILCIAIGKTSEKQFGLAPCQRFFPKGDNLYLVVSSDCDVEHKDSKGNIKCDFLNRTFARYRVSEGKFYDD